MLDYKDIIIKHYVLEMSGSEIAVSVKYFTRGQTAVNMRK